MKTLLAKSPTAYRLHWNGSSWVAEYQPGTGDNSGRFQGGIAKFREYESAVAWLGLSFDDAQRVTGAEMFILHNTQDQPRKSAASQVQP